MAERPDGGPPIVLSPATFNRFDAAVKYVDSQIRTRAPRADRQRFPGIAPHAWGLLASGDVITAISGLILGEGEVTLCTQDGVELTPTDEVVHVYNSGEAIGDEAYGDDIVLQLQWIEGSWAVLAATESADGGGGDTPARCDCPEATYEVEVNCGACRPKMPKYWFATINTSTTLPYVSECTGTACADIQGMRIKLRNVADGEGDPTCEWLGQNHACLFARLVPGVDGWEFTVYDKNDCLIAKFGMAYSDFVCCGSNTAWVLDEEADNHCDITVSLDPDPCTCCPPETPECPPDGASVCEGSPCCLPYCQLNIQVDLADALDPLGEDPAPIEQKCGSLNGPDGGNNVVLDWIGDCHWFKTWDTVNTWGVNHVTADVTLDGLIWTYTVRGSQGQVAVYRSDSFVCGDTGASLAFVAAESSCTEADSDPFATLSAV